MTVKPFQGVRPEPKYAPIFNTPPYDVVERADVLKAVEKNALSFFHVTRADALLPVEQEHAQEAYQKALSNFQKFLTDGILFQDKTDCYYILSQTWQGRTQTGIYAAVSCQEYDNNLIKKHELTRKDKEEDRTNHILTTRADTGPVFLTYNPIEDFCALTAGVYDTEPDYELTDENDVLNKLWIISDKALVASIEAYFNRVPALYIADGHHRAASAVNVWKKQGKPTSADNKGCQYFLAVIFPSNELKILPYNRVVLDLNGLDEKALLEKVKEKFTVSADTSLESPKKGVLKMYMNGAIYSLVPNKGTYPENDPQGNLDVSILQNNLLSPLLGIDDPRTSKRIKFVGGIKGTAELKRLVDAKEAAAAFSLYPVSLEELMAITDRGQIMPPKSTWFEPKLRDGLVVYTF